MNRIIAERTGGPEVLVLSEEGKPEPGPGEVIEAQLEELVSPAVANRLFSTSLNLYQVV